MKLSVKSDYAARAVLGLARRFHSSASCKAEDLARENHIPSNYLVQILLELKAHQIVKSVRGKEGGYLLAKAPAEITLGAVLRAIHGEIFDSPALADPECPAELRPAWQKLRHDIEVTADSMNFQQFLDVADSSDKMYYI